MSHCPKMKPPGCMFLLLLGLLTLLVQTAVGSKRNVDPSSLPCTSPGSFPIPGSCDAYYECRVFGTSLFPYPSKCDTGTIFDKDSERCRLRSTVANPSNCLADVDGDASSSSGGIVTGKASRTALVDNSVRNADTCGTVRSEGICDNINTVNSYSSLVMSSLPLREAFKREGRFSIDPSTYNEDVQTAGNNVFGWKNGESIITGIRQLLQMGTQYVTEFNRRYVIYEENVSKQGINQAFVQTLENQIKKLEVDIKTSEEAVQSASIPQLVDYYNNNINFLKQEITNKRRQISLEKSGGDKLEELSYFINMVKEDARNIENLAKSSTDLIEKLLEDLERDSVTFQEYFSQASEGTDALKEEGQTYNDNIAHIIDETDRLDKQIEDMEYNVTLLKNANDKIDVTLKDLEEKLEEKRLAFNNSLVKFCKNEQGLLENIKKLFTGASECQKRLQENNVPPLNVDEESDKWMEENNLKIENLEKITSTIEQITSTRQEITDLRKTKPSSNVIKQVESELDRLYMFLTDVKDLKISIDSGKDALLEIIKMLQGVECVSKDTLQFTLITDDTTQSDEDNQRTKATMEHDILRVRDQMQQLTNPLSELKGCV